MNRQHVLNTTIHSWLHFDEVSEIVVVDWSSTQPIKLDHIKDPRIKIIRVNNEKWFHLGRAFNHAIKHSTYDCVLKMDVDYMLNTTENFFKANRLTPGMFLTGDHRIGTVADRHGFLRPLNGLLYTQKSYLNSISGYNEKLAGYGYDDCDLYNRLQQSGMVHEFIDNKNCCVFHVPHGDEYRSSNYENKNIVWTSRNNFYIASNSSPAKIDRVVCVNLNQDKHLFDQYSDLPLRVDRFEAIDSRENIKIYQQYKMNLRPGSLLQKLYFTEAFGAVGCFLTHMKIWQQCVNRRTPTTLIIEDDANPGDLDLFMRHFNYYSHVRGYKQHDIVQINNRRDQLNSSHDFNGTESYIITYDGAKKMLNNIKKRVGFNNNIFDKPPDGTKFMWSVFVNEPLQNWERQPNCIVAAVDKFIGMCSQLNNNHSNKIYMMKDHHINLQPRNSTVYTSKPVGQEHWTLSKEQQIKQIISSDNYEWWNKS